jgi:hypothetical protein
MNIEKLTPLLGKWKGQGHAFFPTINRTVYSEELEFFRIEKNHVLGFIQKTWYSPILPGWAEPLHWESGYIKALEEGSFQLSNSQDNGRVEVLKGNIIIQNEEIFHIKFDSVHFGNDERLLKTSRDYIIKKNKLEYLYKMATKKTPEFQEHLKAELLKV